MIETWAELADRQDRELMSWLARWTRARAWAGLCTSVWHCTSPREDACWNCGETGPQVELR